MKIAIVTDVIYPFTIGGAEIKNYEVAKRLVKMGHEVHILGAKLWDGNPCVEIDGIKIHGLSRYERLYKKNGKRSVLDPVFLSIKVCNELLKNNYDIVDVTAFTFFNCYTAKIACVIKKTPLVFTWQQYFGNYLAGYFGRLSGFIASTLEYFSTKLTKNNLAVSNFVKEELKKRGVKNENIKVIYNGADVEAIKNTPEEKKIYDLIFVGRLNYQKNLPLLVESAKILKKDFPNIKIAVVGKGEEKEKLENLIIKYNLSGNFKFLGEIKKKENLYGTIKSAKIFVLPSILEGFPLTIVEANACGLPVITTKTNHNNTAEYIKNNKNGLTANANPKDFAKAIFCLLKNQEFLEKMSETGVKKAKSFNWDKIAQQQEKYYQKIFLTNKPPNI